jgi:hypothetical protein
LRHFAQPTLDGVPDRTKRATQHGRGKASYSGLGLAFGPNGDVATGATGVAKLDASLMKIDEPIHTDGTCEQSGSGARCMGISLPTPPRWRGKLSIWLP